MPGEALKKNIGPIFYQQDVHLGSHVLGWGDDRIYSTRLISGNPVLAILGRTPAPQGC
jgi:hypothetical protein